MKKLYNISIETLYENFGENLEYSTIQKSKSSDTVYYDLLNKKGELAICDGESIEIIRRTQNIYVVKSQESENVLVELSNKEFQISTFL